MKKKLLAVDDEPGILKSIKDLFQEDFEVIAADGAEAALQILRENEVAVILSDEQMPGMKGHEFFKQARAFSWATRILITGFTDIEGLILAINDGQIHACVRKPWDPLELKVTVMQAAGYYEMTRKIENERSLLNALMESVPDPIYVKDLQSRFLRINRSGARTLGVENPDECIGK